MNDPIPPLFRPLKMGPIEIGNRIVVSPMCQYSAHDGCADDEWHTQHLAGYGMSGAGLVMLEATAVERRGRISHGCLGLYSDANEAALERAFAAAKRFALPGTRFGVQLAHAGRKASAQRPWEGGGALDAHEDAWVAVAPSPLAFADGWPPPRALGTDGLAAIREAFADAARRAVRLGFDVVELHGAHGYLLHSFLSPLANQRRDEYGGDLEARMRFPLEIVAAVREIVPRDRAALGLRITGSDWSDGGLGIEDAVAFACELEKLGVDYVCVSSGGITPGPRIPVAPSYQVPFAARVRKSSGLVTRAVGMIVEPAQANAIVADGHADCVALARAFIDNPRWAWHAAERLGAELTYPPQYARAASAVWPGARLARPT